MCAFVCVFLDVCVCVCGVGGVRGERGMQVNSLRRLTVPQASLAHHLTAIPDEGLCTNELVKQMGEQVREGRGMEGCGCRWRRRVGVCVCGGGTHGCSGRG